MNCHPDVGILRNGKAAYPAPTGAIEIVLKNINEINIRKEMKKKDKQNAKFHFLYDYCQLRDCMENLLASIDARDYERLADAIEQCQAALEMARANKITEMFEAAELQFEFDDYDMYN